MANRHQFLYTHIRFSLRFLFGRATMGGSPTSGAGEGLSIACHNAGAGSSPPFCVARLRPVWYNLVIDPEKR